MSEYSSWYEGNRRADIEDLVGLTLYEIESSDDKILFTANCGRRFVMYHEQDCCESVTLEDVSGDLQALVGSEILVATEESNEQGEPKPEYPDSWTWTFYHIRTNTETVTLRWLGESNGYYSESVDFVELPSIDPPVAEVPDGVISDMEDPLFN